MLILKINYQVNHNNIVSKKITQKYKEKLFKKR